MTKRLRASSDKNAVWGDLNPHKCPAGTKLLREFESDEESIMGISFRRDGCQFVTASYEGALRIWNAETGACLRRLTGHVGPVWCCEWSQHRAASRIVSGGEDGTIRVWHPETGDCLQKFTGHSDGILSVIWSRDGRMIVSGSADNTARTWGPGGYRGEYRE